MLDEFIKDRPNLWLGAESTAGRDSLEITFRLKGEGTYRLHWGLASRRPGPWQTPPQAIWPPESQPFGSVAVQSPFTRRNGEFQVALRFNSRLPAAFLVFDLFCVESRRWENNQGKDYYLVLPEVVSGALSPAAVLDQEIAGTEVLYRKGLPLDSGEDLEIGVRREEDRLRVTLVTNAAAPLWLHWGERERAGGRWRKSAPAHWPAGTVSHDEQSVETPFVEWRDLRRLDLFFPEAAAPSQIAFVIRNSAANRWLKHRGQDAQVPLGTRARPGDALPALVERIVQAETGDHGWTLMHRFNLCHGLIDEIGGEREGWAVLAVWLRYSALRQLDWQRNYNTKPRELSHAQDRLTGRLATAYLQQPQSRDLIRLVLACLGRGGEGQRIRDEILQIMHRHHIKEVAGRFMEEWHQKLHNNTTPDDIVICEAYLEFLRSNGNLDRYFETLRAKGVTRERLEGFDRPIRAEPDFIPHLKDVLIHDFENYLKLLKSIHSATDLETAARSGGSMLDGSAQQALGFILHQFRGGSSGIRDVVSAISGVRHQIASRLTHETDGGRAKELLYLDLALDESLRTVVERAIHGGFHRDDLLVLIHLGLQNLLLAGGDDELRQSLREWERLPRDGRDEIDWSLHAKAGLDRLRRAVESQIDSTYRLLQPKAILMGNAIGADPWIVNLFAEEVVRGQPVFAVSLLLRRLDSVLRQQARLGDWQVISPHPADGRVHVVTSLRSIQDQRFEQPTVVVADLVHGDEEPPEGVRAIITPASVDLVSHVAVRARNAGVLFATCYDASTYERLQAMKGQVVSLSLSATGDVLAATARSSDLAPPAAVAAKAPPKIARRQSPDPTFQPIALGDAGPNQVGGKAWHLKELSGLLPDWLHLPRSISLPFGAFDAVLSDEVNRTVAERYRGLIAELEEAPDPALAEVRQCLEHLQLPAPFEEALQRALASAGLPVPADGKAMARCLNQVWASKWNSRAYFSRRARQWADDDVQMAVLIQEVVEAEYAFVIHTVNPIRPGEDELYAEVVPGLGETLVGNHPGRALGCVCGKRSGEIRLLAYPSKSTGLYGGGLIFRSDSNAEDLAGYAGAGLYDSVLLQPAREVRLDYTGDRLVWDPGFRTEFLRSITRLGMAIEKCLGAPQDVEGAYAKGRFHVVQTRPQVGLGGEKGAGC